MQYYYPRLRPVQHDLLKHRQVNHIRGPGIRPIPVQHPRQLIPNFSCPPKVVEQLWSVIVRLREDFTMYQIFSVHGAVQKKLIMSPVISPNTFFTDIISINLKDMYLIFNEQVVCSDISITCPPMTIPDLCLKPCYLISKIIHIGAHCQA